MSTARSRSNTLHRLKSLLRRTHDRVRPDVSWTVRVTGATVVAWVVAKRVHPDVDPFLASLTALMVTQITLSGVVRHSLDRVLSVVLGVTIAALFSAVFDFTWWSLMLLVATSLAAGIVLKVGPNLIEVPISAMVVLGVGAAQASPAAHQRIIETLLGAAIGLVFNLLIPPGVRVKDAGVALERFAAEIAATLEDASAHIRKGISTEAAYAALVRARDFGDQAQSLDATLEHAMESRRLNVRALTLPEVEPTLRDGFDTLEHVSVVVRGLMRGLYDVTHFPDVIDDVPVDYPERSREMAADMLVDLAVAIRSFGALVRAQADETTTADATSFLHSLDQLITRRKLSRQHFVDDPPEQFFTHEFNLFMVTTVGRILRELDPWSHSWVDVGAELDAHAYDRPVTTQSIVVKKPRGAPKWWRFGKP